MATTPTITMMIEITMATIGRLMKKFAIGRFGLLAQAAGLAGDAAPSGDCDAA